jgi:hypothetical protein
MLSFVHQSILICYVILGIIKAPADADSVNSYRHPLHLSSTELNYNTKTATVELSCRIFTDDFEDLLGKKYKIKPDLSAPARHKEMDALINKYMASHMQLSTGGKVLPLTYIGFENDKEAVVVYMESAEAKNLKAMEIGCTVLYDSFDDQTNIFHVTYNGNRKSSKLTYPDKKFVSTF